MFIRHTVRTFSGVDVNLLSPQPETILLEDIAHHCAKLDRYNGASPYHYSVGQHAEYVAHILPPELKLWGLLHDAAEAYLGDLVSPAKGLVGGPYTEVEDRLMQVVATRFALPWPRPEAVKLADRAVMVAEMYQVTHWPDLAIAQGVPPAPIRIYERPWQDVKRTFLEGVHARLPANSLK